MTQQQMFELFVLTLGSLTAVAVILIVRVTLRKKHNLEMSTMWHVHATQWREDAGMYDDLAHRYANTDRVKYHKLLASRDRCMREAQRCESNSKNILIGKHVQSYTEERVV